MAVTKTLEDGDSSLKEANCNNRPFVQPVLQRPLCAQKRSFFTRIGVPKSGREISLVLWGKAMFLFSLHTHPLPAAGWPAGAEFAFEPVNPTTGTTPPPSLSNAGRADGSIRNNDRGPKG